jgi:hypothetical protein
MEVREVGCDDLNSTEMAQDHFYWQVLVLEVLKPWVLLPDSLLGQCLQFA